jgi:thymidylate kinase
MNKSYFIVCEGLDGAGKTTSIKTALTHFAKGYPIIYSKGLKTATFAGKISKLFPSTLTLLIELLYLDGCFVRPNLKKGSNIIQDRWFYSILSHNPKKWTDRFFGRIVVPFLSKPDILIYFSVSQHERIARLKHIATKDHNALIRNPQLIKQKEDRFIKYYNAFQGPKAIIDTTNISEEESGRKVYKFIEPFLEEENNA